MTILFVCTGNICRSPLAHRVFEQLARDTAAHFEVESAGTHGRWHAGENADPRMRKVAKRHGVTLDHPARQIQRSDFQYYDYIFAMSYEHLAEMKAMAGAEMSAKLKLFREYDPEGPGDVPDPYYGGINGFEEVYDIVERTCRGMLQALS